ncbi:MAG: signal peptidase I [Treponema sp.]|nr:signal peptidase I [Treponema sp.]
MENLPERIHFSKSSKILVLIVCLGLLLGFFLKLFVFEILTVSGDSMFPAIQNGDRLFVSKLSYGIVKPYSDSLLCQWKKPGKGDVVIYLYDNKIVVKRCVATGGEKLEFYHSTGDNFTLKAGNQEIPLTTLQYLNLKNSETVPQGFILAVGDNYEVSVDSRTYGFVSEKNILGKVIGK